MPTGSPDVTGPQTRVGNRPARLVAALRRPDVALVVAGCVLFAVARIAGAWGRDAIAYPDTNGYRPPPGGLPYSVIDFAGNAPRSWFLPVVYSAMPSDRWIMVLQVAVSILAWIGLAAAVASVCRSPVARVGGAALVLLLGTTPQVATWDVSLLAESLSISLTAASVAAWLRFAVSRSWVSGTASVALTAAWLFSRPYQYPYTIGIAALLVVWAGIGWWRARRRSGADASEAAPSGRGAWLSPLVLAGVLVVLSGWSMVITANVDDGYRLRDDRGVAYFTEAFGQNMFKRYLNDPEARAFFEERGLPSTEGLAPSEFPDGFTDDYDKWQVFYAEIRSRPEWMAWLDGPARSAFSEYVASHPFDVLSDFLDATPRMLRSPVLPVYGAPVEVPGSWLGEQLYFRGDDDALWFGDVQAWLLVAVALGLAAIATGRRLRLPVVAVGIVTLGVGGSLFFLSWLGSAYEMVRHGVPAVHLVRIGALLLVVAAADALLTRPDRDEGASGALDRSEDTRSAGSTDKTPGAEGTAATDSSGSLALP
jgi:hypothetical protein